MPQGNHYSQAAWGLELRLELSQPRGRSLGRLCDFLPPGSVAMATLHKTSVFAFGEEHPKLNSPRVLGHLYCLA